MKKFMTLLICTLISIVIVVVMPMLFHTFSFVRVESESTNHVGMFQQTVVSVNAKEQTIHKLYYKDELIGIFSNQEALDRHLKQVYHVRVV